ncbi:MAG: helix-turn-helix transcriptional regulator [Deltaproteobacteria bacterium]|nr:helix-turn-helix transcriptional regulator [Deltaproteobacteria bacterium]
MISTPGVKRSLPVRDLEERLPLSLPAFAFGQGNHGYFLADRRKKQEEGTAETGKDTPIAQIIGREISRLRTEHGLSQNALAEKIDISPITLSRIERGISSGQNHYTAIETVFSLEAGYLDSMRRSLLIEGFPDSVRHSITPLARAIGAEIARLRTEKGLTQREFGKLIGVTDNVSAIEHGGRYPKPLFPQIENALHLDTGYFDRLEREILLRELTNPTPDASVPSSPQMRARKAEGVPSPSHGVSSFGGLPPGLTQIIEAQITSPIRNIVYKPEKGVILVFTASGELYEVRLKAKRVYK